MSGLQNAVVHQGWSLDEYFKNSNDKNNAVLKTYLSSNGITEEYMKKNWQYGVPTEQIKQFTESTTKLGIAGKVAASGVKLLGTALKGIVTGFIITGIYKIIDNAVNASKKLKEEAEELKQSYQSNTKSIQDNMSEIQSIADEFNKLSKGVDSYGNNISLTNEQYDRYKELCNKVIDINPTLIEGYNEQSEAILNVKDAIEQTNIALNEQLVGEKVLDTSNKNLLTYFKNAHNEISDLEAQIDSIEEQREDRLIELFRSMTLLFDNSNISNGIIDAIYRDNPNIGEDENAAKVLQRVLDYSNLMRDKNRDEVIKRILDEGTAFRDEIEKVISDLLNLAPDGAYGVEVTKGNLQAVLSGQWFYEEFDKQKNQLNKNINAVKKIFSEKGQEILEATTSFSSLSDKKKSVVSKLVSFIDYDAIYDQMQHNESRAISVYKNRINEILNAINETNLNLDELWNFNGTDSYNTYQDKVTKLIKQITNDKAFKSLNLTEDDLRIALGFSVELNNGQVVDAVDNMYDNIMNRITQKFGGYSYGKDKTIYEKIRNLTVDQIKTVFNQPFDDFKTLDDLWNWMANKTGSFDIADYSDDIKKLSETLTNLKTSMDQVAQGSLGSKDVLELLQEFPELEDYVDTEVRGFGRLSDGLINIAKSKPDELLTKLKAVRETMAGDTSAIDRTITLIEKMQRELLGMDYKGLNEYSKAYLESLIKELEDANKELETQKKLLEDITGNYEKAQNAVETVLNDEISSLQERQSTIKDYYDSQIELLKAENEEREKNIDLQEKQKALDDAKRNKTRVYSAARGWTIQSDSAAIAKAQAELDEATTEDKIAQLEAQRDKEDKALQDNIDNIESYLKLWEKATKNNLSSLEDRKAAQELLGDDWEQRITNGDKSIIGAFKIGYEKEVRKLFGINTEIEDNNAKIDMLNGAITEIDGILGDNEKGLNQIWDKANTTDLTVSNISETLSDFVTWVKTEAVKLLPPTQEEEHTETSADLANRLMGAGFGPISSDSELVQRLMSTAPGTDISNNAFKVSPIIARPTSSSTFSPTITNYFNANHIDETYIANWFDRMLENKYSEYLAHS